MGTQVTGGSVSMASLELTDAGLGAYPWHFQFPELVCFPFLVLVLAFNIFLFALKEHWRT